MQPDACLLRAGPPDGARIRDDGFIAGAPQIVGEIATSGAAYDLHDELELYREAGVQVYFVWQPLERPIDWSRPRDGRYQPLQPDARGMVHSEVYPGLRRAVSAAPAAARCASPRDGYTRSKHWENRRSSPISCEMNGISQEKHRLARIIHVDP